MDELNLKPDPDQADESKSSNFLPMPFEVNFNYPEEQNESAEAEPFNSTVTEYLQNEPPSQTEQSSWTNDVTPIDDMNLTGDQMNLILDMPTYGKRKHETLTLVQKMEILSKVDKGMPYTDIASEYNIGRATVYDIRKNRHKIENYVQKAKTGIEKRQTMRPVGNGKHPKLEEALFTWFLEERRRQTPINSLILRKKALEFYYKIYQKTDFRASERWLAKFRARFGIHLPSYHANRSLEFVCEPVVIVDEMMNQSIEPENSCSENSREEETLYNNDFSVRPEDALDSVDICIKWAEENGLTSDMVKNLQEVRKQVVKKIKNST